MDKGFQQHNHLITGIGRATALMAAVLAIASLSACSQPYTYAQGVSDHSADGNSTAQGWGASDNETAKSSGTGDDTNTETRRNGTSNGSSSGSGTQASGAAQACQTVADDASKAFDALKNEVDNADINTDMLLAKDPELEVKWELAAEDLTKPDLSCNGSISSMRRTVKTAQKLTQSYKKKLTEVKQLISQAEDELSLATDPSTLPTDDSLESRIAQAKAVLKDTANGGVCDPYLRKRFADVLAVSQDMLTSGTASKKDMQAQSDTLYQITQDMRQEKCLSTVEQ